MDNFNLRKYLAEGKLLKETKEKDYYNFLMDLGGTELAGHTFQDMMKKRNDFNSFEDFLDDEIDFFQEEGDVEIIDKIKSTFLNENKILEIENLNPIWVIDSFEDNADISDAGSEYKTAVINTIKAKHPNISSEDLEKSIEVTNDFWYDEARENSKGSDPEEIEVSAEDFADSAIEYYEDIIMYDGDKDEDSSPGYQSFDDYIKGEKEAGNY